MAAVFPDGVEVELRDDLTRYHPSLRPGIRGRTSPPVGLWARTSDRFCSVAFPEVRLDILWTGLRIVDERVMAIEAAKRAEYEDAAKGGRIERAEVTRGPQGGFRFFSVTYRNAEGAAVNESFGRDEYERWKTLLDAHGVQITTVTVKGANR